LNLFSCKVPGLFFFIFDVPGSEGLDVRPEGDEIGEGGAIRQLEG